MTIQQSFSNNCMLCSRAIFIISIVLGLASANCYAKENVSGDVKSGFRILDVDPKRPDNTFTIYRGDYVKLRYPDSFQTQLFVIDDLKYSDTILPQPGKSPFFKMKQAGTYAFQLGEGGGAITVIELIRPNYTEVTASEASELLKNLNPFILDVRTPPEYEQAHIEGTHLIPIQEFFDSRNQFTYRISHSGFADDTGNRKVFADLNSFEFQFLGDYCSGNDVKSFRQVPFYHLKVRRKSANGGNTCCDSLGFLSNTGH